MIHTITEKAKSMILDSQALVQARGLEINTAVYLSHRSLNDGLK